MSNVIIFETNKYFNLDRNTMMVDGIVTGRLPKKPFQILEYLAENSPIPCEQDSIRTALKWPIEGSLSQHIGRIRKVLGDYKNGSRYTYIVEDNGKYYCSKKITPNYEENTRTISNNNLTDIFEMFDSLLDDVLCTNIFRKKDTFPNKYTERKAITDEIKNWISKKDSKTLYITGGLGCGKSSIINHLFEIYKSRSALHICTSNCLNNSTYIKHFLFDLAYQISKIDSKYRESMKNLIWHTYIAYTDSKNTEIDNDTIKESVFNCLFRKTEAELFSLLFELPFINCAHFDIPILIFIDAIDELDRSNISSIKRVIELFSSNSIAIKTIASFRSEKELLCFLAIKDSNILDLDEYFEIKEIESYIKSRITSSVRKTFPNDFIHKFAELCNGNYKYAEIMCNSFNNNEFSAGSIDIIPKNLFSLYSYEFSRNFSYFEYQKNYKTALSIISFFNGQIEKKLFIKILNWSDDDYLKFIIGMRSLIVEYKVVSTEYVAYCHKSIDDWLKLNSHQFSIDIDIDAKPEVLRFLWTAYKEGKIFQYDYNYQKLLYDLILSLGTNEQRTIVNKDLSYLLELQQNAFYFADLDFSKNIAEIIEKNQCYLDNNIDVIHSFIRSKISLFILEDRAGNSEVCLKLLSETEKYIPQISTKYPETVFDLKVNKFWYLKKEKNYCEAEILLDEIEEFLNTHDFPAKIDDSIYLLYFKGCLKYSEGKYTEAQKLLQDCISDAKLFYSNRDALLLLAYNMIGWCYFWLNDIPNEIMCFEESLRLRIYLYGENNAYTAVAKDSLARSLSHENYDYTNEQLKRAQSLAEEALALNIKLYGQNSENSCRNYDTLSLVYYKMGDYNSAYNTINISLDYRKESDDQEKIAMTKKILADICYKIYEMNNDEDKGLECKKAYKEAYDILRFKNNSVTKDIVSKLNNFQ